MTRHTFNIAVVGSGCQERQAQQPHAATLELASHAVAARRAVDARGHARSAGAFRDVARALGRRDVEPRDDATGGTTWLVAALVGAVREAGAIGVTICTITMASLGAGPTCSASSRDRILRRASITSSLTTMSMASDEARVVVGQALRFRHDPGDGQEYRAEQDVQAVVPLNADGERALARWIAEAQRHRHQPARQWKQQRQKQRGAHQDQCVDDPCMSLKMDRGPCRRT